MRKNAWITKKLKRVYRYFRSHYLPDDLFLEQLFKKKLGYELDLKNPKTFNEKIQWLKLNDRSKLHTQCADKYAVREYIGNEIGEEYLIPLVYHTQKISDIKPENLPDYPVIIKTNHDSKGSIMVFDKNIIDWTETRKKLSKKIGHNYYRDYKEWVYKNIPRKILVEKLLLTDEGKIPFDYKVYCFNGQPRAIEVSLDRFNNFKHVIYDLDWNRINAHWIEGEYEGEVVRPKKIKDLISLSKCLSKDFIFVRVDFYIQNGKVYFGEITFYPAAGFDKFQSKEWDLKFGEVLKLPIN